jgi:hypothetical protein
MKFHKYPLCNSQAVMHGWTDIKLGSNGKAKGSNFAKFHWKHNKRNTAEILKSKCA